MKVDVEYLAQNYTLGNVNQNFLVECTYTYIHKIIYTYGCCLIVLNIFLYFDSSVFDGNTKHNRPITHVIILKIKLEKNVHDKIRCL